MDELFEGIEIANEVKETLTARLNDLLSKKTTDHVNKAMDGITTQLADLTGIERLASETKSTDYFKRAIPTFLDTSKSTYESKIKELNEKLESSAGDENLKSEFEKVKALLAEKNKTLESFAAEKESLVNDYESKLFTQQKNIAISKIMPVIDPNTNEYEKKARIEQAINDIETNYKVSFDNNGVLIASKDYTDKKVEDLLKEALKDIAPKEPLTGGNALQTKANKPVKSLSFTPEMNASQKKELVTERLKSLGYKDKISSVNGISYAAMFSKIMNEANDNLK